MFGFGQLLKEKRRVKERKAEIKECMWAETKAHVRLSPAC